MKNNEMSLSLRGSSIDQPWRELVMRPTLPKENSNSLPFCSPPPHHPYKLCLLQKMICAGKEPGSKCGLEELVWREGERLGGESWARCGSPGSVTVADKVCCVKCPSGPCRPRIPGAGDFGSVGARAGSREWMLCSVSATLIPIVLSPCLTHISLSKPLFFVQMV